MWQRHDIISGSLFRTAQCERRKNQSMKINRHAAAAAGCLSVEQSSRSGLAAIVCLRLFLAHCQPLLVAALTVKPTQAEVKQT